MYLAEKYTAEGKYKFTTIDGNDATQAHSKYNAHIFHQKNAMWRLVVIDDAGLVYDKISALHKHANTESICHNVSVIILCELACTCSLTIF